MFTAKDHVAVPYSVSPRSLVYEHSKEFSWSYELQHIFSSKFLNILWWPVFKFGQRSFTNSPVFNLCAPLPGFSNLWKTIQKGSFAYNTLFLGITPFHSASSATSIADITTLALFFGDEFIDGIRLVAGKDYVRKLVDQNPAQFHLRKKIKHKTVTLQYAFDLRRLLPPHIMEDINPKYGITYDRFYALLKYFLQLINDHLAGLRFEKAESVADNIVNACNTCFESYLHDVNCYPVQDGISDVPTLLQFHELKTRCMQKKLLELRCILAGREYAMNNIQTLGWLNIMRVVQIYDDMQDIVADDGFQDNLLLCAARCYFPEEWHWFADNKDLLAKKKQMHVLLSLYMPCSIQFCLQMIYDKIKSMNWEQQKIMHYLLLKNWFVAYRNEDEIFQFREHNLLSWIYRRVKDKMPHLSSAAVKSYAVEACFHITKAKDYLLKKADFTTAYQLRYNLLSMSIEAKAAIFDKITAN